MTESQLLDTLSALVDKSIVIRLEADAIVRFRMLETVQEFGREKAADSGQFPSLLQRHRDWRKGLVHEADAELIGPHQLEWLARQEESSRTSEGIGVQPVRVRRQRTPDYRHSLPSLDSAWPNQRGPGIRFSALPADPLVAAGCSETLAWVAADSREATAR
ncbi:hypothetical protein [Nocardia tengchongensis]|uniref:hypothetical protein n=1 Tax=Nocardia tengchongensis TaxID=2055889 RepID=UPI0036A7F724